MLFTFAENFNLPVQRMCLKSLKRHNPDALIFDRKSICELEGGEQLLKEFGHISNLHFSDLFRTWYISRFGGTWVDADCIHLRRMEEPEIGADQVAICYADSNRHQITQSFMHAPEPGRPFLDILLERQMKLIRDKGPVGLEYLDLGEWSINFIREQLGNDLLLYILPHWEYHYIAWYNKNWFHQQRHWGDFQFDRGLYNPNAYCYHLTNAVIGAYATLSEEQMLNHRSFTGFLFKRALADGFEGSKDRAILKRLPDVHGKYHYAEIGVYKGYNTAIIGQQRTNATIYGIDPWKNVANDAYRATGDYVAFQGDDVHEQCYQEALAHNWFLLSQKRVNFIREPAMEAVGRFLDDSLDMVFLDGDHSAEAVAREIKAWYPKVKPGGYLAGHDYRHPQFASGVHVAVDAFVESNGFDLELDDDFTWFVKRGD